MSINPTRPARRADRPTDRVTDTAEVLFSDARRRTLLGVLRALPPDSPVELDVLAERVAAAEAAGPPSAEREERVVWSLYEGHLPVLEAAGLVEIVERDGIYVTPDRDALESLA